MTKIKHAVHPLIDEIRRSLTIIEMNIPGNSEELFSADRALQSIELTVPKLRNEIVKEIAHG